MQSLSEQIEDGFSLFSGSGNGSPDDTKSLRSFSRSKAAGDFLFQFNHAHISLGLVVVKRNPIVQTFLCEFISH